MCNEVQHVGAIDFAHRGANMIVSPAFGRPIAETDCVNCGQCAAVCPTAAITIKKDLKGVWQALYAPNKRVVVQIAPAVRVAIGEEFGIAPGKNTIGKIYTADQMQNFLMDEVAVPVMDLLTEFRQSSSSELVKNVLALIKQTRGDITLNECADRLNYNPSYIWKVLRTEKDTSFSDLANNEKLEMAKELLLTSDMTVVQIAETLNYSNVQNFIRFFSKKVGMTPGKYRKDYQNEKK